MKMILRGEQIIWGTCCYRAIMRQLPTQDYYSYIRRKTWCYYQLNFKCYNRYTRWVIGEQYNTYDSVRAFCQNFFMLTYRTTVRVSLRPKPSRMIFLYPIEAANTRQLPGTSQATQGVRKVTPNLLIVPVLILSADLVSCISYNISNFFSESGECPTTMMVVSLKGRIWVMVLMRERAGGVAERLISVILVCLQELNLHEQNGYRRDDFILCKDIE